MPISGSPISSVTTPVIAPCFHICTAISRRDSLSVKRKLLRRAAGSPAAECAFGVSRFRGGQGEIAERQIRGRRRTRPDLVSTRSGAGGTGRTDRGRESLDGDASRQRHDCAGNRPAGGIDDPADDQAVGRAGTRAIRCAWTDASAMTTASRASTMGRTRSCAICAPRSGRTRTDSRRSWTLAAALAAPSRPASSACFLYRRVFRPGGLF